MPCTSAPEVANAQSELQKLLTEHLAVLQGQNPRYSLRAFSKRLGLAPGAVSGILNVKRLVSKKMAERIASGLLLDPVVLQNLLSRFDVNQKRNRSHLMLAADEFKMIADWEHKAILSLLRTREKFTTASQIAYRFGISVSTAKSALDRLQGLKLIKVSRTGRYLRIAGALQTTDGRSDSAIKRAHEQSFELARNTLYEVPVECRDVRSITMAISPEKIQQAKVLINEFHDQLSNLLESGSVSEVYRFTTALFPLSKTSIRELNR